MREKQTSIRLTPEEAERLALVARHHGMTGPQVIRWLIRREEQAIQASTPPSAPSKRRK
jgi:predicted DNA-binding protein